MREENPKARPTDKVNNTLEAAENSGERRAILQAIGPVAKLAERKIGTDQNGRVLTAIYRGK